MELQQLQAFVAVARELRFSRAAEQLHLSPARLSELIRRLETELGTPLFMRTTRRVELTSAGSELLPRAQAILAQVDDAERSLHAIAEGESGLVRLGVTPPVASVLAPHLLERFAAAAPLVSVDVQRLWLPDLIADLSAGQIDVAITCGLESAPAEVTSEELCAERLLVGLRDDHRLADRESVSLQELREEVVGVSSEQLFPAWALSQRQALAAAAVAPPTAELQDTDLAASRWIEQRGVDWVLLISSLSASHTRTRIKPVEPAQRIPFTLHWVSVRPHAPAVSRFVTAALEAEPPPGWLRRNG